MKKIILTSLLLITAFLISSAQWDDRFYFPSAEWNNIENLDYDELFFNIDSDSINAIILNPEIEPIASILFYHGAGGNISTYTNYTKSLVKAGFQVFMIDFRGYGKSTGTPTHNNIAKDAQIVFDIISKRDDFKHLPIIVYGVSMGTQIATKIAKDNQSKIAALILDGTISSFTDMALLSVPEEQKPMVAQYVTSPYSAKNDIKEINNLPKLLIHSKDDMSVPFEQGELVFNNAQEPRELWIYDGDHLESAKKYPEILIQKINTLLKSTKK